RSSDYGSTYTKLNLMPGTTIIVTNFYICPTNKKKVTVQLHNVNQCGVKQGPSVEEQDLTPLIQNQSVWPPHFYSDELNRA
ncbi:VPS10 domain-containing receptor SorCS2, partial [Anabarilius grahami]